MPRLSNPLSLRPLWTIVLVAVVMIALGCANGEFRFGDPFDRQLTLSQSQHRYTVLVRWNEFQKARSFVAKDGRDEYMLQMKALDDARFTSYESEPVELDQKKKTATIQVTYTLYTPSIPYELEIIEMQEWTRSGITNDWNVVSTFNGLRQLASN